MTSVEFTRRKKEPRVVKHTITVQLPTPRGATRANQQHNAPVADAVRVAAQRTAAESLQKRRQAVAADEPAWRKRGLFGPSFTMGPRLKGARLFTKGKIR